MGGNGSHARQKVKNNFDKKVAARDLTSIDSENQTTASGSGYCKAVRANSKKNKIYFLKLKNEQIFTRSDELPKRVNTTKTRSDVPSRREHRKATASGGGHFTCSAFRQKQKVILCLCLLRKDNNYLSGIVRFTEPSIHESP
jgi:hypothetical protein